MSNPKFIRFEPHGPADTGLVEWEQIEASELETASPVQRGHIYHQDKASGYMAGVWDCTPMTAKFGPYPVHEFMFLLEGSVTMVLKDGTEVTVNAGEAFVIPKGLPCQWKQPGYVRKFFMIFENPGAQAADDVASQGIILPQPSGPPRPVWPTPPTRPIQRRGAKPGVECCQSYSVLQLIWPDRHQIARK